MKYLDPIESVDFPGFYEIPGFKAHAISREGYIVTKETGRVRREVNRNSRGYRLPNGLFDDTGRRCSTPLHRLMCLAFKYPDDDAFDPNDYEVNHINGVKGDDRLDNLEWATGKENVQHAWAMGLTPTKQPITVRDIDTGEITKFDTIRACAKAMGLNRDSVIYRIRNRLGEMRVFPERKQYRDSHSDSPWFIPPYPEHGVKMWGRAKRILMRRVLTGEVTEFGSLGELANYLNMGLSSLSPWTRRHGQPVLPGYIQLKWAYDPTPWRDVEDPEYEMSLYGINRAVKVEDTKTGDVTIYNSGRACAAARSMLTTTLAYRLKSNGASVFSDGCRYSYYDPRTQQQTSPLSE